MINGTRDPKQTTHHLVTTVQKYISRRVSSFRHTYSRSSRPVSSRFEVTGKFLPRPVIVQVTKSIRFFPSFFQGRSSCFVTSRKHVKFSSCPIVVSGDGKVPVPPCPALMNFQGHTPRTVPPSREKPSRTFSLLFLTNHECPENNAAYDSGMGGGDNFEASNSFTAQTPGWTLS